MTLTNVVLVAFKMLDSEGKGFVSKEDLAMFLKSIESTLNKYNLGTKHLKDVTDVFFPPNSNVQKLSLDQFTQIVSQNFKVVQSLGRLTNKAILPEKLLNNVKRRGLAIAFGHEQWELTQNMLLGFTKSVCNPLSIFGKYSVRANLSPYLVEQNQQATEDVEAELPARHYSFQRRN